MGETVVKVLVGAVFISMILGLGGIYQCGTQDTLRQVKVTDKEAVNHGKATKYLIYTQRQPLENQDAIFHGKFNSSTVYSRIEPSACYNFDVYGWRVPFFSMYKNIIGYEKVDCSQ